VNGNDSDAHNLAIWNSSRRA